MPEPLDYGRTPRRRSTPVRDLLIGFALALVLCAAVEGYIIHAVRTNLATHTAARSAATLPATTPAHP